MNRCICYYLYAVVHLLKIVILPIYYLVYSNPYYVKNGNQEPKQIVQPHGSHAIALSQVFPNNLNGVILT